MGTPDPGPCRAAFTMFYYDASTSTCQSFIYGGCRGNNNRYSSLEECMASCGPSTGNHRHSYHHVLLYIVYNVYNEYLFFSLQVPLIFDLKDLKVS